MSIEEEFNCLGYYGFGSGVSVNRAMLLGEPERFYCTGCPQNKACWVMHKERMRQAFPDVCEFLDTLTDKDRLEWVKNMKGGGDPVVSGFRANLNDAISILRTGKPKDRGEYTLKYPFEKV